MEPFATSTTVTGPVGERLQAGTENASVLDRPTPLRRLHDFGAGYKYLDLLTYSCEKCEDIHKNYFIRGTLFHSVPIRGLADNK